jgi:hypothetical protein
LRLWGGAPWRARARGLETRPPGQRVRRAQHLMWFGVISNYGPLHSAVNYTKPSKSPKDPRYIEIFLNLLASNSTIFFVHRRSCGAGGGMYSPNLIYFGTERYKMMDSLSDEKISSNQKYPISDLIS